MITALSKSIIYFWLNSPLRRIWFQWRYQLLTRFFKQKPKVEVYLALNDPYSFVLVQLLEDLQQRFKVTFELYLVYENTQLQQATKFARQWAINDANQLAKLYKLVPITQQPSTNVLTTGQQIWQLQAKTITNAWQVFEATWANQYQTHEYYAPSTPVINTQIKNQIRQQRKGHYQSASLYFYGMWFAGIERLAHFEKTLIEHQLSSSTEIKYNQSELKLLARSTTEKTTSNVTEQLNEVTSGISVFIAINSLYSYLGWHQARQLSEHYQIPLTVKIVLPFVMQGIVLPVEKRCYALFDGYREAKTKGIDITNFADLERQDIDLCYSLFSFAEQAGKANEYIDAVFHAVFVKELDISLHKHLQSIYQNLSLDYDAALAYNQNHDWQQMTDNNHKELTELGFWGVPCFSYQNTACWGQDKLWQIERSILTQKE